MFRVHLIQVPGLLFVSTRLVSLKIEWDQVTVSLCITVCPCLSPLCQILGTLGVLATFFWLLFTPMDYNLSAQQQLQQQKKRLGGWSCDV